MKNTAETGSKIKVSTLTDAPLDCWAVKALGYRVVAWKSGYRVFDSNGDVYGYIGNVTPRPILFKMSPSTDWAVGGPIIEREDISLDALLNSSDKNRKAASISGKFYLGPTCLIAAMRAYVASKFGEEVDVEPSMWGM